MPPVPSCERSTPWIFSARLSRNPHTFSTAPPVRVRLPCASYVTPRNSPKATVSGFSAARHEFSTPRMELNTGMAESLSGVIQSWPIFESAAFMFAMEPVKVSFAAFAESPNAEYMASEKVWKSILPAVTILETSSEDLPK